MDATRVPTLKSFLSCLSAPPVAKEHPFPRDPFLSAETMGSPDVEGPGDATPSAADPVSRVHSVVILVSDEVPFDMFWPMVGGLNRSVEPSPFCISGSKPARILR